LQEGLAQLQASPTPDMASVSSTLTSVSSNLRSDAGQLTSAGHSDLAAFATNAATAVDALNAQLAGASVPPSGMETAIGAVSTILQQLPASLCPA
jgi:hypothetical protein